MRKIKPLSNVILPTRYQDIYLSEDRGFTEQFSFNQTFEQHSLHKPHIDLFNYWNTPLLTKKN